MKKENGITLIALIITIIVMLILLGVTINLALNGGLITNAKQATIQTEIAMIQEQLMLKKAEIIADNMGSVPASGYGLSSISDLDGLSESTITKYNSKLVISSDGTLYYLEDKVTGEEKVYFKNARITAYQEQTPEPEPPEPTYPLSGKTFKLAINPSLDSFNIVFSDTTFTFYGATGTYEYNSNTNKITGNITIQDTPNTINADFYTSGNNNYFLFEVMGSAFPMSLNGSSEGIRPFDNAIYVNPNDNNDKWDFVNTLANWYCYFEQTNTLYYGGEFRTKVCTHNEDYSSITIDGVTYTKQ